MADIICEQPLTGREETWHTIHKVKVTQISPSLLLSLASLKWEQNADLDNWDTICTIEEEGRALVSLLERCCTWRVEVLELAGEVGGQTWERLARGRLARGRLGSVVTGREVVRRGRREDLWRVWRNTEVGWDVGGEGVWREDGEDQCWQKIEAMIQ